MQIDWQAFTDGVTESLKVNGYTGDSGYKGDKPLQAQRKSVPSRRPETSPVNDRVGTGKNATGYENCQVNQLLGAGVPSVPTVPSQFKEGHAKPSGAFSDCLRKLRAMPAPDAFWGDRWERLIGDGEAFVTEWGEQAASLSWDELDLFGVHPTRLACRFDVMGLVPLIDGGTVVALTEKTATIKRPSGSVQRYTRQPMIGAVRLWELAVPA